MRKVFVSYYHGDQDAVNKFVNDFSDVCIFKTVGVKDGDFDFDSTNPEYIMRRIREEKLEDSTVTIVLIGDCTHSRRYVDWEIKASLQQGSTLPNGLILINLPYKGTTAHLPKRGKLNYESGYAKYYSYPSSKTQLTNWIEEAYSARTSKSDMIKNSNEMMKYNKKCNVHNITH